MTAGLSSGLGSGQGPEAADKHPLGGRLNAATDLLLRHDFRCWSYGDSIGFEGLVAASRLLRRPEVLAWAHGYLRAWAARSEPFTELDNTAPGHAACMIYDETRDELIVRSLHRLAQWLRSRPRIDEVFTTFSQSCLVQPYGPTRLTAQEQALVNDPGPGVYVDCLHFDPPFLAHLGSQTDDPDLVAEAITQATGYIRLLYDDDTGLFHHFYLERTRRSHIMGWGRGQGWAILGLLDLVEQLPATNESRAELVTVIGRLADAMRELQRPDGHWFAIVNEPESGSESSTAAFLAAAFWKGIELGILDDRSFGEAAERAWQATIRQLLPDGVLSGVSAAVQSSTAIEHYFHVPTDQLVPWGQGPALLAAARRPGGIGE